MLAFILFFGVIMLGLGIVVRLRDKQAPAGRPAVGQTVPIVVARREDEDCPDEDREEDYGWEGEESEYAEDMDFERLLYLDEREYYGRPLTQEEMEDEDYVYMQRMAEEEDD